MFLTCKEIQNLATNKKHFVKCGDCDLHGKQYWDGYTGLGVNNTPAGINPDALDYGLCESCRGYGYYLRDNG